MIRLLYVTVTLVSCVLAVPPNAHTHNQQPPFFVSPGATPRQNIPAAETLQQPQDDDPQQIRQQPSPQQAALVTGQEGNSNQPPILNAIPNVASPQRRGNTASGDFNLNFDGRKRVEDTQVQCLKTHMSVTFRFSEPFNGYIYPHHQFTRCLLFKGQNQLEANLRLRHGTCGDQENRIVFNGKSFLDPVIEHRLMIQWERNIVSEHDSTVIVRCDRPDDFNRTVEWKFSTRELSATLERSQHPGPKMVMEIQKGEGPSAPPLGTSQVFIGDVLTLVFTLTDNVYWFDSNVFSCHALDGGQEQSQVQWDASEGASQVSEVNRDIVGQTTVIENSCSVKLSLFSHFKKERNTMPNGDLVTLHYVYFKAFRFPTSMRIVLQCDVQVCYKECPVQDPCSEGFHPRQAEERSRRRREAPSDAHEIDRVEMMRSLQVLLKEEGAEEGGNSIPVTSPVISNVLEEYCYSPTIYYGTVIGLVFLIVILIVILTVVCFKIRMHEVTFFTPTKNVQ